MMKFLRWGMGERLLGDAGRDGRLFCGRGFGYDGRPRRERQGRSHQSEGGRRREVIPICRERDGLFSSVGDEKRRPVPERIFIIDRSRIGKLVSPDSAAERFRQLLLYSAKSGSHVD